MTATTQTNPINATMTDTNKTLHLQMTELSVQMKALQDQMDLFIHSLRRSTRLHPYPELVASKPPNPKHPKPIQRPNPKPSTNPSHHPTCNCVLVIEDNPTISISSWLTDAGSSYLGNCKDARNTPPGWNTPYAQHYNNYQIHHTQALRKKEQPQSNIISQFAECQDRAFQHAMVFVHSQPFTGNSVTKAQPFRLLTMRIPSSSKRINPKKRKAESQSLEDEPEAVIVPESKECFLVAIIPDPCKFNVFSGGFANAVPLLSQCDDGLDTPSIQSNPSLILITTLICLLPKYRHLFLIGTILYGSRAFHAGTSPSSLPTTARPPGSSPMESAFYVTGPGPPIELLPPPTTITNMPMDILTNISLCLLGLKQISSRVGSIT